MNIIRRISTILLILAIFTGVLISFEKPKKNYLDYFKNPKLSIQEVLNTQEIKYHTFQDKNDKYLKGVKVMDFLCFKGTFLTPQECSNEFALLRYEIAPIQLKYMSNKEISAQTFKNGMHQKALINNYATTYVAAHIEGGLYPEILLKYQIYPYLILNNTDYILKVK